MTTTTVALKWWDTEVSKVTVGEDSVELELNVIGSGLNQLPKWTMIRDYLSRGQYDLNPLKVGDKVRICHFFEKFN